MATIKVGNNEILLDEAILIVNHDTINDFLSKYASWYRHYQNQHNNALFIYKKLLDKFTALIHSKFKQFKQEGGLSDKMSEAMAKSDEDVIQAQERMRIAEYVKDELWGFLRSMDYAHEDALQLCYNIRKEMDKIGGSTIRRTSDSVDYGKLTQLFAKEEV